MQVKKTKKENAYPMLSWLKCRESMKNHEI
jgi:hypothetical protein